MSNDDARPTTDEGPETLDEAQLEQVAGGTDIRIPPLTTFPTIPEPTDPLGPIIFTLG